MEGLQFRQFRGDKHRDMLTIGQGTLLHIRVLTDKGLQFKLGWLRVTTVKKKVILLDSVLNQKGPRTLHGLRRRHVLSKVPFHDTNIENDTSSQSVQENQYSEQLFFDDTTEIGKHDLDGCSSFGRHLEEIHLTWDHLEKKRTRLQTYTKSLKELCIQSVETASQA
ncbi:hypothetical protein Tco_0724014 [Tanacetum coccineum]